MAQRVLDGVDLGAGQVVEQGDMGRRHVALGREAQRAQPVEARLVVRVQRQG